MQDERKHERRPSTSEPHEVRSGAQRVIGLMRRFVGPRQPILLVMEPDGQMRRQPVRGEVMVKEG